MIKQSVAGDTQKKQNRNEFFFQKARRADVTTAAPDLTRVAIRSCCLLLQEIPSFHSPGSHSDRCDIHLFPGTVPFISECLVAKVAQSYITHRLPMSQLSHLHCLARKVFLKQNKPFSAAG